MTDKSDLPPLIGMLEAARPMIEKEHPLFSSLGLKTTLIARGEVGFVLSVPEDFADGDHVHGGIFTILLDTILGYSVWSRMEEFAAIATINLKTDFFGTTEAGQRVHFKATCEGIRDDVAVCSARAECETTGELIATGAGTFMVGTRNKSAPSRL